MFFRQLRLLLWKNFVIRLRHPIRTFLEVLWPILLFSILIIVRTAQPANKMTECHYPARALPSAGVFPWIETMFCNLDNPCFNVPVASETPGQINEPLNNTRGITGGIRGLLDTIQEETTIFEAPETIAKDIEVLSAVFQEIIKPDSIVKAAISSLLKDADSVKGNLTDIGLSDDLASTVLQSQVTLSQILVLNAADDKQALVCNETALATAVTVPDAAPLNLTQASTELCALSNDQLDSMWNVLTQNADFQQFLNSEETINLLTEAGLNSGENAIDLGIVLTIRLPILMEEFGIIGRALAEFMSQLQAPEGSNGTAALASVIGYDFTTPEGFQEFCGHPEPIRGYGQLFFGQMIGAVLSLADKPDDEFCTDFINIFENNEDLSFIWTVLKPILFGKIPYSPDTNVTRDIMRRANATFGSIAQMESLSRSWSVSLGPAVYAFLENDPTIELLRTVLDSGANITGLTGMSEAELETLKVFLSNDEPSNVTGGMTWKSAYNQLDYAIVLIHKMLKCTNLDKFEGYKDESALIQRSFDLLRNNTFWAGIVFLSPTINDTTMPKHIKYKIRQDVDDVMRTDFIKTYFWEPGPGTGVDRIRYLINGFADMQDMMELGITRAAADAYGGAPQFYGAVPKLGYYLQQMPYPCYTSDSYWSAGPNANYSAWPFYYYTGGFLFIQDMIDRGIESITASPTSSEEWLFYLGMYLQEFPYPCYKWDPFLEYLGSMMSLLMTLAWIYSVCIMIKNIVYEKEQRLKEFMKMMGLSNGVHWVAWFINSFYLMFISSVLLVLVLNVGNVLPYSNPFIILIWLLSFCIATIAQCFLISCFFTRANLSAACGGIIYFVLYIPYNFAVGWEDELSYGGKIGLSLFSTVSFGYGATFATNYEMTGTGLQFSNWNVNPKPGERYTFLVSLLMMLVDAVIYFILTWYVEAVYPGKYGIPRPPYFMFTKSYWLGTPTKPATNLKGFTNPNHDHEERATLEDEPTHLPLGVSVRNLTKIYNNGKKLAVDDLSLNFYEGHITSFLGHNGAGKTTTMSILCGLFTPTEGTAYIHGNDIRTDMDTIRSSLGMCPQHNVLFRDLTVKEHLDFYAGLRGATDKVIREGTDRMIEDVGLPHKRNEVVHNLSGGMKRKLSVAVAFIGDSKTVILDEPTAGVDPYARRGIWDLLLKYKQGRTIILSTHHMDEADLLGDRIAIISQGSLKCCGSSLYLKSTFGVGYYLTLVKQRSTKQQDFEKAAAPILNLPVFDEARNSVAPSEDEGFASKPGSSKASSVSGEKNAPEKPPLYTASGDGNLTFQEAENLVRSVVPNAKVHDENVREITFILPYEAIRDGRYTMLFQALDSHSLTYGLTDTSLEEIFLSVADHEQPKPEEEEKTCKCCDFLPVRKRHNSTSVSPTPSKKNGSVELVNVRPIDDSIQESQETTTVQVESETIEDEEEEEVDEDSKLSGKGSYQLRGRRLIGQQFFALMIKRLHHARRNRKGIFAQIILPSAFVLIALCFTLILPPYEGQPPLELQPWMYGDNLYAFYSDDSVANADSSSVSDALVSTPGLGTRCMTNNTIVSFEDILLTCVPQDDPTWKDLNETKGYSQSADTTEYANCSCQGDNDRILLAECPNGAGGSPTPLLHANTTDFLYDMSGRDVSDWLVKTTDRYIEQRYGGLSVGEKYYSNLNHSGIDSIVDILQMLNVSIANEEVQAFLQNMWRTENGQVWFDNNGFHAMPAWLNVMSNGILRSEIPAGGDASEYGITVYNHPMNYTEAQVSQAAMVQTAIDTSIAIVVVFAMSFVPASFVIFLIDERVTKSKHLQFISGVNQSIYWIANFVWDMVNYLVPSIIVIIIFLCFQTDAYVSSKNLPALILLLLLYGWSITPMMYPFSFLFQVPSTAYVVLTCINLFIGINTSIATLVLQLLEDDENLKHVNDILQKVFLIFPHYCLGRGLIDLAVNQATADAYAKFGIDSFVEPLSWDMTGKNLFAMAVEGVVFFIFNLLVQYNFFVRPRSNAIDARLTVNNAMEEDVVAEKRRILEEDPSGKGDILRVTNMSKVYQKLPIGKGLLAVDRMCFGVSHGECFGLLGVNGAGKTTTFKVLTGDETPTAGDATVCGDSIKKDIRMVQQNTGYCPQFDALNSHLTGFEHLQLYARLRGVPKEEIDRVAEWGIAKLGLKQYAHKPAGTYSGGNKRKLSAAIAFIGCPPVIFLDEPTAGMDPRSRRFLWKRILDVIKVENYNRGEEQCVVLTSHSMEECEALCTRLAIMVNGRFMCLGTPQHLKNKYGKGYTVTVRVGGDEANLEGVQNFLFDAFPGAVLKERHHNMIVLQLPLEVVRLSEVFELVEMHKESLHIEDYSISQTTLDEVFISFAKLQTDGEEVVVQTSNSQNVEASQISPQQKVIV